MASRVSLSGFINLSLQAEGKFMAVLSMEKLAGPAGKSAVPSLAGCC